MNNIKSKIEKLFLKHLNRAVFSYFATNSHIDIEVLKLKLNSVVENLCDDKMLLEDIEQISYKEEVSNYNMQIDDISQDKPSGFDLSNDYYKPKNEIPPNSLTPIDHNFQLNYEMIEFAKSKYVRNVNEMFEDFKYYYQGKGTLNHDWEAVWRRWVLNHNQYAKHLLTTPIDKDMSLSEAMIQFAKEYIDEKNIEIEFLKFKNHYIASGDLKVSWRRVWENWCINSKQFKPKEQTQKAQEKANYRWDFRKAKDTSDRIKDWLEFEKGINWLEDFYLKDIPIPGIGWQEVMHPDFNKEEILLYKIDSKDGQFMLNHKSDDIIEAEVLEND